MENEESLSLLFWISTSVMLFLAITILLITLIYHKKTGNIKQRESEILLKATLEAEKKERKRIASDFHDSISGDLSAIRNYINILDQKEGNAYNKTIIYEIKNSLGIMLTNVKHINYNLMPPLLDSMGLIATLNDYFDRTQKLNKIEISTQFKINNLNIDTSDAYQLFRILQEITSNILNHNNATQISISIYKVDNDIFIEIIDNGFYFNFFDNLKLSTGLGLKNILSRLNHIGAILKQPVSDKGNKLIIKIKEKL